MPTIMIPQRLWKRFGLPAKPPVAPDDDRGRLGNWSVTTVPMKIGELALFVSQRTCLTIVTHLVPLPPLLLSFAARLGDELVRHGVASEVIEGELEAVLNARLGKNTDRSLLGTVNDLVWHAQCRGESQRSLDKACDVIQAELNGTPHCNRIPVFPDEAVAQIFATRH